MVDHDQRKKFDIASTVRFVGEFEHRAHEIVAPEGVEAGAYEIVEGSYPLGLTVEGNFNDVAVDGGRCLLASTARTRSPRGT